MFGRYVQGCDIWTVTVWFDILKPLHKISVRLYTNHVRENLGTIFKSRPRSASSFPEDYPIAKFHFLYVCVAQYPKPGRGFLDHTQIDTHTHARARARARTATRTPLDEWSAWQHRIFWYTYVFLTVLIVFNIWWILLFYLEFLHFQLLLKKKQVGISLPPPTDTCSYL